MTPRRTRASHSSPGARTGGRGLPGERVLPDRQRVPAARNFLGSRLEDERAELRTLVTEHAAAVHAWLDGFGDDPMPFGAAAGVFLMLAAEEAAEHQ